LFWAVAHYILGVAIFFGGMFIGVESGFFTEAVITYPVRLAALHGYRGAHFCVFHVGGHLALVARQWLQ
jgi:hypothetical protein